MLVVSRKESERVLFPSLGIAVEVLRIQGNKTRLGIDAPADVPVLRHEIAEKSAVDIVPQGSEARQQLSDLAHAVRRRLDSAANTLNALHETLDLHGNEQAQRVVCQLYKDLRMLEFEANEAVEWSGKAKTTSVLVVEDNAVERKLLAAVLELSGMQVATAEDGLDALQFFSMHAPPDAVLLDMCMPRCNGPDFVRRLRSRKGMDAVKIFAVSSADPAEMGLPTGIGGIDGWFPKPLDPAELLSALDQRMSELVAA